MSPKQIFGGLLAVILLGLFIYLLVASFETARLVVACAGEASCIDIARATYTGAMESALSTIGGLVAAIVIAELAITKPSEIPAARLFAGPDAQATPSKFTKVAAVAYVSVWVLTGLASFVWASLQHPDALKALTDYGNAWFGLAVASGYSYFGVERT